MMRNLLVITLLCLSVSAWCQKPSWTNGYHKDLANSYIDVYSAVGNTEEAARKMALQRIVDERSRATGRRYSINETNGNISMNSQDELSSVVLVMSIICASMEAIRFTCWYKWPSILTMPMSK